MSRSLHNKSPIHGSKADGALRPSVGHAALRRVLVLSFVILVGAYAVPARAGDASHGVRMAFDLPSILAPGGSVPSALVQPVSQSVLAEQRGSGAAFAIPAVPVSQSQPGIVLWDELKPAQAENISTPSGEAANQINPIQIR